MVILVGGVKCYKVVILFLVFNVNIYDGRFVLGVIKSVGCIY